MTARDLPAQLVAAFERARPAGCPCTPASGAHVAPCPWAVLAYEREQLDVEGPADG